MCTQCVHMCTFDSYWSIKNTTKKVTHFISRKFHRISKSSIKIGHYRIFLIKTLKMTHRRHERVSKLRPYFMGKRQIDGEVEHQIYLEINVLFQYIKVLAYSINWLRTSKMMIFHHFGSMTFLDHQTCQIRNRGKPSVRNYVHTNLVGKWHMFQSGYTIFDFALLHVLYFQKHVHSIFWPNLYASCSGFSIRNVIFENCFECHKICHSCANGSTFSQKSIEHRSRIEGSI